MDVAAWLQELGMEAYVPSFRANDIDLTVLQQLTEADLASLGVRSVGHRRKLAGAINALRRPKPVLHAPHEAAERRQITIMFCDLVDSTALAARLDPEELRAILTQYHATVTKGARRFDGFVAKYMGDGVLVYFGYPQAHEDDAERAVHAGLEVLRSVARMSAGLQARIGLATGRVVVGDLLGEGAAQEQIVVGETPNLAARLQALAAPGTMVVAASTRRLLGEMFRLSDLGPQQLKGLAGPVRAWAVQGALASASRFEAMRRRAMADMAGRDAERRELLALRRQAWAGEGQILVLSGEPGIGKSRLAAWICDDSASHRHRRFRYQCSQYHQDSPLHPFIAQVRRVSGFQPGDGQRLRLDKLTAAVAVSGADPAPLVPLLAALLEIPGEPLGLPPAQQRTRTLHAFSVMLTAMAQDGPVLLLFEDAHWADATSLELLDLLGECIRTLPVLLVVTCRPDFPARWAGCPNAATLVLDRLDEGSIRAIVAHAANDAALPDAAVQWIVDKAEGIPLFAEELARTVGEAEATGRAVPDTLHDLLMARLDSMAAAKEVAQIGAVIGREFPRALLQEVHGQGGAVLDAALARLQDAALVYSRSTNGRGTDGVYVFKHALVQDAAYDSLLKSRRNVLHQHIAEILGEQRPDHPEAEPEIVAQHYARAGLLEEAVCWWGRASGRALLRSAYAEAIGHCRNALALVDGRNDVTIDRKLLLQLHLDHGQALGATRGYNAPEAQATFAHAHRLTTLIADPSERFSSFYGLWSGHFIRGDLTAMVTVAEAFLRDAMAHPGAPEAGVAQRSYGISLWYGGNLVGGRHYLEQAAAHYDPMRDDPLAFRFGHDVGLAAFTYLALVLWPLGEVERAAAVLQQARTLGLSRSQANSVAYVHFYTAVFDSIRLAPERAASALQALNSVTQAHELTFWHRVGMGLAGWVACRHGDQAAGMVRLRQGLAAHRADAVGSMVPVILVLQADVARSPEEVGLALSELDAALRDTGPHWMRAEMLRMRGELLLRAMPPDPAGAATAFRTALAVAEVQQARSFRLRAAVSLTRLVGAEAVPVLRRALDGFTAGPDFPEVAAASRLLAVLG